MMNGANGGRAGQREGGRAGGRVGSDVTGADVTNRVGLDEPQQMLRQPEDGHQLSLPVLNSNSQE